MVQVGTFDASQWVAGNYATYPQLPPGVTLYQPTMHWLVVGAGTIQGQHVVVGDLLFATQGTGRTYGQNLFGDQIYGGVSDGDWTVDQVFFLKWDSTLPPPDTVPYPNAGCRFTRPDLPFGDWAPGWRIVIDAHYNDRVGSRVYGELSYGAEVYGDTDATAAGPSWVDITRPAFHIETGDGTNEGAQTVVVSEVVVNVIDEDGVWFDVATPQTWFQPQPGTALRVGLIDPAYRYHPVITAEIERIEDVHDGDHPRVVSIRGFGRIMDLTVDVPNVQRPAELASTRFRDLVGLAGWWWDQGVIVFPPGDAQLIADAQPRTITVRDELDRTVQACGWFLDSDQRGRMRVRTWPHQPEGTPLEVVDCAPLTGGQRLAHVITYANDQSKLLNWVVTTNTAQEPQLEVSVEDVPSISRFGRRGRALDYPKENLPWADPATTEAWARRILNRFAYITRHAESLEVDTALDPGWLAVLADLETGQAVTLERRGIRPVSFDGMVVGWRYTLDPGRWTARLFTSTTNTSM